MKYASIGPIAVHFPEKVETNEFLAAEYGWDMKTIHDKTGIGQRFIAAPNETAADLAVHASEKLFERYNIDRKTIDFVLLCTQTPDYPLPTTACLVQSRLGLPTTTGALDFNLGCSGFVYGLSIADGLIRTGVAKRILLLTAETYSKYIHPTDRSLRTIFGDAAAATLIDASDRQELSGFRFGTDGTGADTLIVSGSGARPTCDAIQPRHRKRWPSQLYMDGPSLMNFTVSSIPGLVDEVCSGAGISQNDIDLYLFHQATRKMLDLLQETMHLPKDRYPIMLEKYGNTVSCTLPILIEEMRNLRKLQAESYNLMIGFGVGWSWAGCTWKPHSNNTTSDYPVVP